MTKPSRLLGIDPGRARLGLAISDPERRIASPFANYTRRNLDLDGRYLQEVIASQDIGQLVIGLPVHLDGHEGEQARAARAFGQWLAALTGLPCVFWDERFSTWEAETSLSLAGLTSKKRKARRDQVAAQFLLQAYIDAGCLGETTPGPLDG